MAQAQAHPYKASPLRDLSGSGKMLDSGWGMAIMGCTI